MAKPMQTQTPQHDRTALVTGGATGIGWATACALAQAGVRVAICCLSETLAQAKAQVEESGYANLKAYAADVTCESDMQELFRALKEEFGSLNYLVNNAGKDGFCYMDAFSLTQFRQTMDVNVSSVFIAVSQGLALMRSAERAAIVNIGSIHGHVTTDGRSDYVTSKTALIGATRALALDLAPYRIRVNMVSPGAVDTPMLQRAWAEKAPHVELGELKLRAGRQHPCGRIGKPDDIAQAVCFLLSEQASFITGIDLLVDGGLHAKLAISSIWGD